MCERRKTDLKRVVFAAVLLACVIIFNISCLCVINGAKNEFIERLDVISAAVDNKNSRETALECAKFTQFWMEEHHLLCRIVRHESLDLLTVSVARLTPLAEYGERGELAAEVLRCKILMEEIYDSERPLFRNIF